MMPALPLVDPGPRFDVVSCDQRTPEWFAARLGRLTGSRAADALAAPLKNGGEPAGRRNLRVQLVLERITGQSQDSGYCSPAMQAGIDREGAARAAYEAATGEVVQTSGFLAHPSLMAGTSLDGHLGDYTALVEIKCPLASTHLEYLRSGQIPANYLMQVRHALWITGAAWCDWVSYGPEFPADLQLKIVRVTAVARELDAYELLVRQFLAEVDRETDAVRHLSGYEREPGEEG
jgi:putative phage-type endonuclease